MKDSLGSVVLGLSTNASAWNHRIRYMLSVFAEAAYAFISIRLSSVSDSRVDETRIKFAPRDICHHLSGESAQQFRGKIVHQEKRSVIQVHTFDQAGGIFGQDRRTGDEASPEHAFPLKVGPRSAILLADECYSVIHPSCCIEDGLYVRRASNRGGQHGSVKRHVRREGGSEFFEGWPPDDL